MRDHESALQKAVVAALTILWVGLTYHLIGFATDY